MTGAALEQVQTAIDAHPYLDWLGLKIKSLGTGDATLTVPYEEKLANPSGPQGLHGGVSSAVLDAAGAIAIASRYDEPAATLGQGSIATTDLNVSYLRPATESLRIEADTLHVGESSGVVRIVARDNAGDNVVAGRGTYRIQELAEITS